MDLVKIGFLIEANGLEKANKEVDALLAKAARLKGLGGGVGTGRGSSPSTGSSPPSVGAGAGQAAQAGKSSEKLIRQQELLAQFLPLMDKHTASLAAKFKALSDSTAEFNRYLTLVGSNKSFLKQQEAAEKLIASNKKLQEQAEKDRQKALSKEQQNYQKSMEQARAAVQTAAETEEKARQKKLSAEQKYYQKQMELARTTAEGNAATEDKARQKKLTAEQKYYQKQMEQARASVQAATDAEEKARRNRFSAEQKYYQKQMEQAKALAESKATSEEKARQKRFAAEQKHYQQQMDNIQNQKNAEKAKLAQQQRAIDTVTATSRYQSQGLNATNAGKVARLEISGADAATVTRYKQALLDAQAATQALGNATREAGQRVGFFNTQIGGIIKYAVLSAVIYGAMSAVVGLGVSLVKTADAYTSIQNRMRLYISDANELTQVNEKLAQYAVNNNVGLRETSTLFARLAPSMQKIGANTAAVTTVVDAFGKSMRIGGATATEAASATLQFSQAMASGKLAGDEFRSISEASPRFLKAIADGSGIAASKV